MRIGPAESTDDEAGFAFVGSDTGDRVSFTASTEAAFDSGAEAGLVASPLPAMMRGEDLAIDEAVSGRLLERQTSTTGAIPARYSSAARSGTLWSRLPKQKIASGGTTRSRMTR